MNRLFPLVWEQPIFYIPFTIQFSYSFEVQAFIKLFILHIPPYRKLRPNH